MEKDTNIISPFTGGKVKEIYTTEEHIFRKEKFNVHVRYYIYEDTAEKFTTSEQDGLLINDLYSQYRTRHNIPFPDEIASIRRKYKLNLAQISKILGFGANQYAQYENGQIPSESNGRMILAIKDKETMLRMLEASINEFCPSEYEKIKCSIIQSADEIPAPADNLFFRTFKRSIFNGYTAPNCTKLQQMIKFFAYGTNGIFPTKLNKMMFYADFNHYRLYGKSISGLTYNAIQYGPVPTHYSTIYDNIEGLEKEVVILHDMETAKLSCKGADMSVFSKTEKDVLSAVLLETAPMSTAELIELSHKESAWINHNPGNGLIPYDEAFSLNSYFGL